jgi:hypothetical protein
MTQPGDIGSLRAELSGIALTRSDSGYDEARSAFNGAIDRYPAVIARCADAADVATAIKFARQCRLEVSVRGGFHSAAGSAICDDGLMIDLSSMRLVTVNPATRRARVGGGATLADVDGPTQEHGLAVPAGIISDTGVGGLTLGGGMGWLTPLYGLAADNLVSAEVVSADGRLVRAAADENPDLLWALRGGGGNFGVVTEFEFQLHPVGPVVHVGLFFYGLEQGTAALRLGREIIATQPADANLMMFGVNAPPAPFVPEQFHFMPCYALAVVGFGTEDHHARIVARIREALPPLFDFVTPIPYVQLQQMFDQAYPWGVHAYDKSLYLNELSDGAIAVIGEHLPRRSSPMSAVFIYWLGNGYTRMGDDDTGFGGSRSARFSLFLVGAAGNSEVMPSERDWVRSCWAALRPHAQGPGSYVNMEAELGEDRVRASYGPVKYERLARIKAKYDPDNVFHHNANIKPALQPI